ncbi:MAG: putative toxin-antitoxin system toxin component, PIN family [Planctomycetota bacterium]
MGADTVILDTNVFVAAGFRRRSACAQIIAQVRDGQIPMVWNQATRRETQAILEKIPRLSWSSVAELFRAEGEFCGTTTLDQFDFIRDPDDRKFAALASATEATLVTSDDDLLSCRDQAGMRILTPAEYWRTRVG